MTNYNKEEKEALDVADYAIKECYNMGFNVYFAFDGFTKSSKNYMQIYGDMDLNFAKWIIHSIATYHKLEIKIIPKIQEITTEEYFKRQQEFNKKHIPHLLKDD